MNDKHNTYVYCISFFSLSSRFKMMFMEVELVQQKKKEKRGERGKWYAWEKNKEEGSR
jgi:hypothetical protein